MIIDIPEFNSFSDDDCRSLCLKQILQVYDSTINLKNINQSCEGTLKFRDWDYYLGIFSISKGFDTTIHTRSLTIFDPSWFSENNHFLINKLGQKKENLEILAKNYEGFNKFALEAAKAKEFLEKGGRLNFKPFSNKLIENYILDEIPLLITVTGQLIYNLSKEKNGLENDLEGDPWKHSLVIRGFDKDNYFVMDPSKVINQGSYKIKKDFLLDGIIRYDSNILVVKNLKKK